MTKLTKLLFLLTMTGVILLQTGCGAKPAEETQPVEEQSSQAPQDSQASQNEQNDQTGKNPQVTFELMDGKTFVVELLPEYAPNTVNNFLSLAKSGFYEGTVFHRILPGLIIQGGGIAEVESEPGSYYEKDCGYAIKGEFIDNGFNQNTLKHERGVISTARTSEHDSAGSQFFIMQDSNPDWDGAYAGFGKVISGMETVDFVNQYYVDNGFEGEIPMIKSVTVETFGGEYPEPVKVS